jgi:acid phosphatase (class A)
MRNVIGSSHRSLLWLALAGAAMVTVSAGARERQLPAQPPASQPAPVPELIPGSGYLIGYIADPRNNLPNSFRLLLAPPAAGSGPQALDDDVAKRSFAMRGTPRWTQAISDAKLSFPHQGETYSCSIDAPVNATDTPFLYQMLRRVLTDAGESTYAAKNKYNRPRPFLINKQPICTPEDYDALAKEGSYPSGHTAVGWAQALILAEIVPDRQDAILKRGLSFGESRNVCNAHWFSDVLNARIMGAATVARLHAVPEFNSDLTRAKAEIAAARAKGLKPSRDCAAEAAALGQQPALWP